MQLRVMVYSHDTYGLGNIRRMLAISDHLLSAIPGTSILLVTGSPMVHEFRIQPGLDYIKLPCLSRTGRDEYSAKSLGTEIGQLMQLRSGLISTAARDFEPDVVLIDKKPDGVKHELRGTLELLRRERPQCRVALVLRDILDTPKATIASWKERDYSQTLRRYFDSILILGSSDVFDAVREYEFPPDLRRRTQYCGYLRREAPDANSASSLRTELLSSGESRLVLVTPGGGEDGFALVHDYVAGMGRTEGVRSLVVCGPEMPPAQRDAVKALTQDCPSITVREFTGDLMSHMAAADVVVSMAGYNTICEILSLNKRAVCVPRFHPVREQWIRAERLSRLGLIDVIHPDRLTPEILTEAVTRQLTADQPPKAFPASVDGLNVIAEWVKPAIPHPVNDLRLRRLACQTASLTY